MCLVVGVSLHATGAAALEAWDGRLQAHGFVETIARTYSSNFSDNWDLTQWQFVVNLELELDIAPDGWGPMNALSAYSRIEARYDCVWRKACTFFQSVDAFGDRANKGQRSFTNGFESPFTGTAFGKPDAGPLQPAQRYLPVRDLPLFEQLFDQKGPDQVRGTGDEPAPLVFGPYADYTLTTRQVRGAIDGVDNQIYGPWRPRQTIDPIGARRIVPNALSPLEKNLATGEKFSGLLTPLRPVPTISARTAEALGLPLSRARGIYLPSAGLIRAVDDDVFSSFDQNFRQSELEWNYGGAQQDERELKELYLDAEFLDGRLFVRLGLQTVVWGKTEIFRSQDQFNPQDVSLATLPSLEESRVNLWAARGIYSFYDVGPLEDVRLELAVVLDAFEPIDIGACGEPYAPLPAACQKSFGLFIHGLTGAGLAGEVRPPTPYEDLSGIELGGRLEWRWSRFSFALTDFWGHSDIPFFDPIFDYERNVDPRTGRPRFANVRGGCDPEGLFDGDTSGCLASPRGERAVAATDADLNFPGRIPANRARFLKGDDRNQVLRNHHANQTLFHTFCAATVGFTDLLPGLENECIFNIFSSQARVDVSAAGITGGLPIVELAGLVLGGSNTTLALAQVAGLELTASLPFLPPLVPLNARDPRTGEGRVRTSLLLGGTLAFVPISNLASLLSPEQQAILGCGVFYGTSCDNQGVDLMNAEAGVLLEAFPGFEGTPIEGFSALRGSQPGTLGFDGGTACTRFERGHTFLLPGCRGPEDPGYDPRVDGIPVFAPRPVEPFSTATPLGDITGFNTQAAIVRAAAGIPDCPDAVVGDRLFHPFTCAPFRSELSALSFNLLMVAVIISADSDDNGFSKLEDFDEFDPSRPFADDRCSFSAPQFCSVVRGLFGASGVGRQDLRAAGNGRFGRRDFLWHGSREVVLRYNKRNVLGFSADFAEDVTKTNWSMEFTWFSREVGIDRDSRSGTTDVDTFNLTISVDRPTFVNFLNANRTLFFNTQLFLSYVPDHTDAFQAQGPVNALLTFTALTGYFQDRLLGVMTTVYDFQSNSGAVLPNFVYRFNERLSLQLGLAYFFGGFDFAKPFVSPLAVQNRVGSFAYNDFVENGLSIIRQRDEIFGRLRWTF